MLSVWFVMVCSLCLGSNLISSLYFFSVWFLGVARFVGFFLYSILRLVSLSSSLPWSLGEAMGSGLGLFILTFILTFLLIFAHTFTDFMCPVPVPASPHQGQKANDPPCLFSNVAVAIWLSTGPGQSLPKCAQAPWVQQ